MLLIESVGVIIQKVDLIVIQEAFDRAVAEVTLPSCINTRW